MNREERAVTRLPWLVMVPWFVLAAGALALPNPAPGSSRLDFHFAADTAEWLSIDSELWPLVLVPLRVEGVPALGIVDSGAGLTVLSDSLARELSLTEGQAARARGAGGERSARLVEGVDLQFGALALTDRRVVAVDLSGVRRATGLPVMAIVGADVFREFVVDLDYPRRRMRLRDPRAWTYEGSGTVVPARSSGGQWRLSGSLEGEPETAFDIDTGSDETLTVYAAYAEEHGLLDHRETVEMVQAGIGGTRSVRAGTVARIEVAGYPLQDVPIVFDEGRVGAMADRVNGGNLGAGILSRFRVIFDVPHDRIVLEPGDLQAPFPRDRSGLQARWTGEHLEVVHVAPGSPAAEAGWEVGDRIVSIDGMEVGPDTRLELRGWNERPEGTRVTLVDASGQRRVMELRDYY